MKKLNTSDIKDPCYSSIIQTDYLIIKDELYINFNYCCLHQYRILSCKFEDAIKNFDKYFNKCLEIIKKTKICNKCKLYNNFPITSDSIGINNGLNLMCSQKCKFCVSNKYTEYYTKAMTMKKCVELNKVFLETLLKSANVKMLSVSCRGEPFEDPYIKNTFVFNLHKSNIKHITFLTNGLHFDKDYLMKLKEYGEKYNLNFYFLVNCSAFNKELYESYCTGKFEVVVKNITNLFEIFKPYCSIKYILSDHNINIPKKKVIDDFKENFPDIPLEIISYSLDFKFWNKDEYKELYDKVTKEEYLSVNYDYNHSGVPEN